MFEQNNMMYNFPEEFEDLTPNSSMINDTFDSMMSLGFDDDTENSISSIPNSPRTPSTPNKGKMGNNNQTSFNNVYPLPNYSHTNLHQQSFAPIYYNNNQSNNNTQNSNTTPQQKSNNVEFMNSNLPFWSAAPLPFIPEKYPPTEIIPNNQCLTEKDQKRLHRQEAIKKWMSKRTRRDFNRKVAPQKSQAAISRQRIGGKFITSEEETKEMEKEIQRLKKQVEEEEIIAQSLELKLNQTHMELSLLRSHGLVNGMLKSQMYYPTLEPQKQMINSSKDPRQSTIDYNQVRTKLKKTGMF